MGPSPKGNGNPWRFVRKSGVGVCVYKSGEGARETSGGSREGRRGREREEEGEKGEKTGGGSGEGGGGRARSCVSLLRLPYLNTTD